VQSLSLWCVARICKLLNGIDVKDSFPCISHFNTTFNFLLACHMFHKTNLFYQMSTPAIISATPGATPGILPTPGQLSDLGTLTISRLGMPTPGADSVFQAEDFFDDVFYDEPTPTSGPVWSRAANATQSLRFRGGAQIHQDEAVDVGSKEQPRQDHAKLHPLSAYYIETTSPTSAESR
jgi:hypothetical protein